MEELLEQEACKADYARWCSGDLRQADLVDKWGGEVLRVFQAWFVDGKGWESLSGQQEDPGAPLAHPPVTSTAPDEVETMPHDFENAGLAERRRRTGEAMARRRILHAKQNRRRVGENRLSPATDEGD